MSTLIDALKGLLKEMHGSVEPDVSFYRDELSEIIAEHERSGGWLPIDSCPDDGETEVLLGSTKISWPDIGTYDGVEFYKQNGMSFVSRPTHWQPLPKGPTE